MLSAKFDDTSSDELTAILYAQHWADRNGYVAPETRERVLTEYGLHRTSEIEARIHAVYFGNLCSKTVVAYRDAKTEGRQRPVKLFTYTAALPVAAAIKRKSGVKSK